ncbi:hypothetical protein EMGBS15_00010 [Filimonas sp.]|nr:hypothetical protein EMGBS15_00010 [Filimonas sp.]
MNTPTAACPWAVPIAASTANPFGNTAPGGYVVNPNTGTATFTPNTQGWFVIAFTCYELIR